MLFFTVFKKENNFNYENDHWGKNKKSLDMKNKTDKTPETPKLEGKKRINCRTK